jgi:uncharacterized membrane protein YgcG
MFQTTAPSAAIPASRNRPNIFGWRITIGVPALVCLLSITFLTLRYRGRQRRWNFAVVFTALVLLAVSAGCGGGGGGGGGGTGGGVQNPGTPVGQSAISVTLTINGVTQTLSNLTLNVQ